MPARKKVGQLPKAPKPVEKPMETLHCQSCDTDFNRERARGRKPKFCPECTAASKEADPTPEEMQRRKQLADANDELKRQLARERADTLDANLKAGGNHLSQQRQPRSYRLDWILDRLDRIEEALGLERLQE